MSDVTPARVVVFMDYHNVYKCARESFFDPAWSPGTDGHVNPLRVGLILAGLRDDQRELSQVRVYRGIPSSSRNPTGYSATTRQMAAWQARNDRVHVFTRPLNYRNPNEPKEKGIDVQLAVDFVTMAIKGEYDIGVLFSTDTDLMPAIEAVRDLGGSSSAEVAAWCNDQGRTQELRCPGVWCHRLVRKQFGHVADPTDYTQRTRRR